MPQPLVQDCGLRLIKPQSYQIFRLPKLLDVYFYFICRCTDLQRRQSVDAVRWDITWNKSWFAHGRIIDTIKCIFVTKAEQKLWTGFPLRCQTMWQWIAVFHFLIHTCKLVFHEILYPLRVFLMAFILINRTATSPYTVNARAFEGLSIYESMQWRLVQGIKVSEQVLNVEKTFALAEGYAEKAARAARWSIV